MDSSLWTQTNQDAHSPIKPPPLLRYVHNSARPALQLCSGAAVPTVTAFHSKALSHIYSVPFWIKHDRYPQATNSSSVTDVNHSYLRDASASKPQQSAWAHFLSMTGNFPCLPSSSQWGHENCFDVSSFKPLQSKSTLASNPFGYNSQQQFP